MDHTLEPLFEITLHSAKSCLSHKHSHVISHFAQIMNGCLWLTGLGPHCTKPLPVWAESCLFKPHYCSVLHASILATSRNTYMPDLFCLLMSPSLNFPLAKTPMNLLQPHPKVTSSQKPSLIHPSFEVYFFVF